MGNATKQPLHAQTPASQTRPTCRTCSTGAFVSCDVFVPAHYDTEHGGTAPSVVSYTCRQCGSHYTYHGPEDWVPPGWEWYD